MRRDSIISREFIVLWDIDGTLLNTQGAGAAPLSESIERFSGKKVTLDRKTHAGKSDYEIIESLSGLSIEKHSEKPQFEDILENYVKGLTANLRIKPAKVLGDVNRTLNYLKESTHIRNGLLTGNCKSGGTAKLKSAGLFDRFDPKLSFYATFDQPDRKSVLASATKEHPHLIIVGDTPNDVEAGLRYKIPVISVATGLYSWGELEEINKNFVLKENWKLTEFYELLKTVI